MDIKLKANVSSFLSLEKFVQKAGRPISIQVYEHLRQGIIKGYILPGTALSEASLCHHYGVSRQPIREALLRLSHQNMVEIYPQKGSVVTKISVPMVLCAQLIRESVEVEALWRAMKNVNPVFIENLRNEVALQNTYVEINDVDGFFKSDQKFHQLICQQSGIRGLWTSLQESRAQLDRARHMELTIPDVLPALIEQHSHIIDHIETGDGAAAEVTLRQHLQRIIEKLPQAIESAPSYFSEEEGLDDA